MVHHTWIDVVDLGADVGQNLDGALADAGILR